MLDRRPATALALVGLCAVLSGCVPEGLAFRTDDRLTIVRPADRATVSLPVTIDWDIQDFDITGPGGDVQEGEGYFAVFVDATPIPPGKTLRYVARDDNSCREADGCPDEEYLSARGIYTTTDTELVLEQLPRPANEREGQERRERHRATIVLLDASGTRMGESAFEVVFDLDREG